MNAWIALVLAGVGCFALRFAAIGAADRWSMPGWLDRASGFVMPASFAALCSGALLGPGSDGAGVGLLVATAVTAGVAMRRSPSHAVASGMVAIWAFDLVAATR